MATFQEIRVLAGDFLEAFDRGTFARRSTADIRSLSTTEAYQVQAYVVSLRLERGDKIAGYKVGCTSPAIRSQFGLSEPVSGRLMEPRIHVGDTDLRGSALFDAAVEAEFVFKIGKQISGDRRDDAFLLSAIEWVAAGIEVHNYRLWYPPLTQQELIACNALHAALVIGKDRHPPDAKALLETEAQVHVDGALKARGPGRDVMGGPLASLRWLSEHLYARGLTLKPGHLVIPGSPAELVPVPPGAQVQVDLGPFGSVSAAFPPPA